LRNGSFRGDHSREKEEIMRNTKNKYCPRHKAYLKCRTDILRIIEYYSRDYYCIEIKRMYSIVKPRIKSKAAILLINFVTYHRKMVNEWSGKNLSNVWRQL